LALRHYIAYLFNKRFPMSWAFEGTRSRLGKLMPPKYGLLKYVMDAAFEENIRGVHIVPFVTSFDIIRDVEEYASEQTGRNKKPESFSWFIGYLRSLRAPLGRVYVDLGEPVVVDQAPHPDNRLALSKIAFEVAVQANRATPLTLTSLMCFALLGSAPRAMTASEMRATLGYLAHWALERGIRISPDLDLQELAGIQTTVENLVHSKLLTRHDNGPEIVYAIAPEQHPIASYYRNSIIHHFLDKAIIELALFKARELADGPAEKVFWDETERLRDLFKFEFFYPEKAVFRANIRSELTRVDADWEAKLAGGGPLLKSLTNRFQPLCCQAVFLPFVEAYTIVLDILCRLQPGESVGKDRLVKQALEEGRQAYLLRRITSEASIGKILFENGFKMAASQHLTGESSAETIAARKALRRKFRGLSRRMEKARIEVLALADKTFE
jgi:glycerol-3-phosphate O-acyltransferase